MSSSKCGFFGTDWYRYSNNFGEIGGIWLSGDIKILLKLPNVSWNFVYTHSTVCAGVLVSKVDKQFLDWMLLLGLAYSLNERCLVQVGELFWLLLRWPISWYVYQWCHESACEHQLHDVIFYFFLILGTAVSRDRLTRLSAHTPNLQALPITFSTWTADTRCPGVYLPCNTTSLPCHRSPHPPTSHTDVELVQYTKAWTLTVIHSISGTLIYDCFILLNRRRRFIANCFTSHTFSEGVKH